MERKTMGSFIAVLRKSKGYTQRQLADMLGVSDKTVSHWERDESAPDISMLPIIADIFDVTCDEIIRGQKSTEEASVEAVANSKSEKQIKYLLDKRFTKYKVQTIISLAVSLAGLAFSVFLYWSFAWNAFYIGLVFTVAALCCLIVFDILFKQSLSAQELDENLISPVLQKGKKMFFAALTLILAVQGFTFPEIVGWSFLPGGFLFSLTIAAVGFGIMILSGIIDAPKGLKSIKEIKPKTIKIWLLRLASVAFCFILIFSSVCMTDNLKSRFSLKQTPSVTFTDKDEFIEYMETEKPMPYYDSMAVTQRFDENLDMNGYIVRDEEYCSPDGENELELKFTWRNLEVSDYYIDMRTDGYIIEVVTYEDVNERIEYSKKMETVFYLSIPASVVLSFAAYKLLRRKIEG